MRILEPLLIKQDQGAFASGQLSQEVQFSLAALEGILILGVKGTFGAMNSEVDDTDSSLMLSLNPDDSAATTELMLAGNDDLFWYETLNARLVGTGANLEISNSSPPMQDFSAFGGMIALQNLSAHYRSGGNTNVGTITIYYKRVLLDADELVPFVALRRR